MEIEAACCYSILEVGLLGILASWWKRAQEHSFFPAKLAGLYLSDQNWEIVSSSFLIKQNEGSDS